MARGSGDQAKAFRLVERAVQVAPKDVSARFQLAGMLVERRDYKAAREQFQMCTQLAPDFADGWAHLSNLLQTQGDAAGADRILSIGLQNCPQSPGLHMMRGRRLADQGRLPEAAEAFKNSIRFRPNEADAYVQLAIVYLKSGRDEEAKAELKKALDAEPQNPDVLGFLAMQAITQGNQTDALQWIKLLRQQPRTKTEQMNMVQAAFREKFGRNP
jgi:cytochrome c-type biogenesis protein CcmH/NrfG